MHLLIEGQSLLGTYQVERLLGEGAFAQVYRVRHRFLGRQAMKVFKAVGMTAEEVETSLGEAVLLSRIGHPNVVRVFDANVVETEAGTLGFFTMEYVAGGSLDQFWRAHGPSFVPVATVVDIGLQLCRGLAVAHRESPPIIHRDIKPQNILIGYDRGGMRALVSDFGLAKRANPLTMLASSRGTLGFKAPEALRDAHSDSCAADVWAVGATLYLLLTDECPYAGAADIVDPRRLARTLSVRRPSELNALADSGLDRIVLRALEPDPGDRYQHASEMLEALMAWYPQDRKALVVETQSSLDPTKSVLGAAPEVGELNGLELAARALEAYGQCKLGEAADLMERAVTRTPSLRDQYEHRLMLWRKGIAM